MSFWENQILDLRRQFELFKKSQVSIIDTQPKEPNKQTIWRDGAQLKQWTGKEWALIGGGILDFTTTVVFSSSGRLSVAWTAGVVNIGKETGVASYAISPGSFTLGANTFLYWAPDAPNSIQTTSVASDAIVSGGIILAVAIPNSDVTATSAAIKTFGNNQNDLITADQIVAGSITSNKLAAALIYAGSITLTTNGLIKGGQTAFNTGTGFFLGYSSGAYKFSIGNGTTNYFTYDGSNMVINGGTIQTGTTGKRIVISSNQITAYDSSNIVRLETSESGVRIKDSAGATFVDLSSGTFNISGIDYPYLQISDLSTSSNIIGMRTKYLTAQDSTGLNIFTRGGVLSFKGINNTVGTGVQLSSPDNDTLTISGFKISLGGLILQKTGVDLYWNGVKIN